jgi:hypothetical protein
VTSCAGSSCTAGASGGGCCSTEPYCGAALAQDPLGCSAQCFDSGQGCAANEDCCGVLLCTAGICG